MNKNIFNKNTYVLIDGLLIRGLCRSVSCLLPVCCGVWCPVPRMNMYYTRVLFTALGVTTLFRDKYLSWQVR